MRRSKSDPAKYARNYRSISQRRMTEYDDVDEDKEIERLRNLLQNSQEHLKRGQLGGSDNDSSGDDEAGKPPTRKRRKKKKHKLDEDDDNEDDNVQEENESMSLSKKATKREEDPLKPILSEEMKQELGYNNNDDDDMILMPKKKKKTKKKKRIELTPEEIRQAKLEQKKLARKLKQLTERAEQKKRRTDLYAKLKENAISTEEMELLSSSSTLGKKITKKEALKKILQKERAGIVLTEEERDLLYTDNTAVLSDDEMNKFAFLEHNNTPPEKEDLQTFTTHNTTTAEQQETTQPEGDDFVKTKRNKKRKKKKTQDESMESTTPDESNDNENDAKSGTSDVAESTKPEETESTQQDTNIDTKNNDNEIEDAQENNKTSTPSTNASSFAAQMMASLTTLKVETTTKKIEQTKREEEEAAAAELERQRQEEEERKKRKVYVPTNTAILKTAASLGLENKDKTNALSKRVLTVQRPKEVEENRYDLPVSANEYEIVDAIRNNDVTILCGETGSGKSTQVPQFCYEAGFTLGNGKEELLVGVTQPRRVAAVSTAKRVCYEMGQGDGQTIKSNKKEGNLVSYQTRYETAGLGRSTRVKFMTDGILLQEIQSDLLLRKYSVIILDEAHERNLNTDVLLGLLSAALPLRKEAAQEEGSGLVPLKLVVMSATLRVEDFTKNPKLFSYTTPALVKVPGRTHPVTIHHSKVTELDDYETAAFKKICKIHRKLPQGGMLVFLTGKQEIVRMVNKLRKTFSKSNKNRFTGTRDAWEAGDQSALSDKTGLRDMDDDELDGDLFQEDGRDDFDDIETDDDEKDSDPLSNPIEDMEDGIPKHAYVLPLYSMLSVEEQAKVFASVPEGHRLIVISTNIAETSVTIPGISYVVDTGRQKCRNYHAGTGVASYEVMWISKASADQRAGRAGRTGPGHCYRLYSSSMYSRHMDDFALPEVLSRPLEDVVLAMKAMNISDVAEFPFPTSPHQGQIDGAVKLLANIGCVDLSRVEESGGDGNITRLGTAISKLPLGVRYGKMLLIAAQAGILDYGILMVAVLSESSPFQQGPHEESKLQSNDNESLDEIDQNAAEQLEKEKKKSRKKKWMHKGGDVLAGMLASGAYTYAGKGAGGVSEKLACREFCEENGLNYVVMERIQKMRIHLAKLAKTRLGNADGIAAKTGGIIHTMPPPNRFQEKLLMQAIASGLLDNVALLAPPGSITGDHPYSLRSAYLNSSSLVSEPLFMDKESAIYSRDSRRMPEWICYDTIVRKTAKDGSSITTLKNITPIEPAWLGPLAKGSRLLSVGGPRASPLPTYDPSNDAVMCSALTKFGAQGWEIPPVQVEMYEALQSTEAKQNSQFMIDDSFRWFARFLLEGKVLKELKDLPSMLNDEPAIITRKAPVSKVAILVSALSKAGVDSARALQKHWSENNSKFLFKLLKSWTKAEHTSEVKKLWMETVKKNIKQYKMAHQ